MPATVHEAARETPVVADVDVCVLGGGPAGIAAAASAARHGARTLLVERYGFLGGMGTAAGVTNFCGLHGDVRGEKRRVVGGVASELLERIAALGGLNAPHLILGRVHAQAYDNAAYKCAADALLAARGASTLFHAAACGVTRAGDGCVDALLVETRSGRAAVRARTFVDASGDGELCHAAGLAMAKGDAAGGLLYPTLMFRVGAVDAARAGDAWRTIPERMDAAAADGSFAFPRRGAIVRPMPHADEWRVNVTQLKTPEGRAVDGTNAAELSAAEAEGRRQAVDYLAFLRARVPGFERAYLLELAPQLGIRETRRLIGEATLSGDDVVGCSDADGALRDGADDAAPVGVNDAARHGVNDAARHGVNDAARHGVNDAVGVNGWPLEMHVAGDVVWRWPPVGSRGYCQLPFRMLVPHRDGAAGAVNVLAAGRCASMTHEGHSAARVSGACFAMGQAAGTAAALALAAHVEARDIDIGALQRTLLADGAFLGGAFGEPPIGEVLPSSTTGSVA